MRRYEHSPTPSQPTNMTGRLAPRTSVSIANMKRFRYEKYRPYPRVVTHVSDRVDVDERADQRNEEQHERRERVDAKRGVEGDRLRAEPRRVLPHRHPGPER